MSLRPLPTSSSVLLAALLLTALVACQPAPADGGRTPIPAATQTAAAPAVSPGVSVDGTTVTIVGVGRSQSDPFELPAGSATMTISACRSNLVLPFITLADGNGQTVGLVVDPEKTLNNLAGGTYRVLAQANPDCEWQVVITPQ